MGQEKFQKSIWMLLSSYSYMLQGNARAKCQNWKWTRVIIRRWIPDLKLVWRNKSQCSGWRLLLGLNGLWSGSDRTDRQSFQSVSGRAQLLVSPTQIRFGHRCWAGAASYHELPKLGCSSETHPAHYLTQDIMCGTMCENWHSPEKFKQRY